MRTNERTIECVSALAHVHERERTRGAFGGKTCAITAPRSPRK